MLLTLPFPPDLAACLRGNCFDDATGKTAEQATALVKADLPDAKVEVVDEVGVGGSVMTTHRGVGACPAFICLPGMGGC